ncbi:hypothetical protein ACQ4M3_21315 [Leptolyngbya sp. AN03gr2]|uniref:hypothetical protein n=1 Tax=unclassified Leptolyngbya TaxID=2650499 RepID=UPI003D31218E
MRENRNRGILTGSILFQVVMIKGLRGLLLGLLVGCTPLPTRIIEYTPPRPVDPTPYEKKGYVSGIPADRLPPKSEIKVPRTVVAKPGQKLSENDLSTLLSQAEDKAISAENLARSAQSKDDWSLVIDRWKLAIEILKPAAQIPRVRQALTEYERNLSQAQIQAKTNPRQLDVSERSTSNGIPLMVKSPSPSPSPSPSASPSASPSPESKSN